MGQSTVLLLVFMISSLSVSGQDSPSIHIDTLKFVKKSHQRGEGLNGQFMGYRTYYTLEESYQPKIGYNKIVRENGDLYLEGQYILVDTTFKRVGFFKFYTTSGQLDYVQDFETNQRTYYFDNGTKKSEGIVNDSGKRKGIWTCYYPTGQIKSKGEVEDTLKKGTWEYFNEQGKLKNKKKYKSWTGAPGNQDCCDW